MRLSSLIEMLISFVLLYSRRALVGRINVHLDESPIVLHCLLCVDFPYSLRARILFIRGVRIQLPDIDAVWVEPASLSQTTRNRSHGHL